VANRSIQDRVNTKQGLVHPSRAVYYYRVEHPGCRIVPIGVAEFKRILQRYGYLLDEGLVKGKGSLVS